MNPEIPAPDALNLAARLAVWEDGTTTDITNLIDSNGDDTDSPDLTVVIVCKTPDDSFLVLSISHYERLQSH